MTASSGRVLQMRLVVEADDYEDAVKSRIIAEIDAYAHGSGS